MSSELTGGKGWAIKASLPHFTIRVCCSKEINVIV